MNLFHTLYQRRVKNFCLLFFFVCFLGAISYERISLSTELSQDYVEQVNERLNRLEKKMENFEECYVMIKAMQKNIEMIQRNMNPGLTGQREKPGANERLEIQKDKSVDGNQNGVESNQSNASHSSVIQEEKPGINEWLEAPVNKSIEDIQKDEGTSQRTDDASQDSTIQDQEPEVRERLESRMERLEETVQDLTDRSALMDTAEEIRRVTEYVCPNGHGFETKGIDEKCSICGLKLKERTHFKKFKFARRESISERIAVTLEEEFRKRILVGASGTGIFQQILNDSGDRRSFAEGSMDLIFIGKPLTYTTFFVDLEAIGGNGPDEIIDSLSGLNDDAGSFQDDDGVDRVSVREAWLQFDLFNQNMRLVAGKLDLTNYFDINSVANDETTQFITSAFVNNPVLEVPENGPGIVSFYDTRKGLFFGLGLQSADNAGSDIADDLYGIGEVGIRSRLLFGRESTYRLWVKINGGQNNNKGLGISIDQHLSAKLVAFARYGINETDGANIKSAWSTGLELRHPFLSRVNDSTAFAFGRTELVDGNEEHAAEMYYKYAFNDHLAITPLLQAVFNPAGLEDSDVVFVAGMRMQIEF